ncbi:MAG TPA: YIP1 family protein [Thermomicrobiales bacterium]|nr:YIP1 family protein [Thermomicrobiales bacterium]
MAQSQSTLPRFHQSINADTIIDRIKGTATFSRRTIASIAADRSATIEAGIVVALVGVAGAIGHQHDVMGAIVAALIGWVGLAGAIWFVADRFMGTPTSRESFQPLLRTIGYALAPASLVVIHFIWGLGPLVAGIGTLWSFAATVFAVRYTTQFGWVRSLILTIAGGIFINIAGFILSVFTGIDPQIW